MSQAEGLKTSVLFSMRRLVAMDAVFTALELIKETKNVRGMFPEPLDIFNHSGNLNASAQAGCLVGLVIGRFVTKEQRTSGHSGNPDRPSVRSKMALGGFVVGAIINGLSETKLGIRLVHMPNTADPLDFAYGLTAATFAASVGPRIVCEPAPEEELQLQAQDPQDSPPPETV